MAGERRRGERGSIFVETLIACVLVASALAATLQVVADAAARSAKETDRREATLVAQSALAAVGSAIPAVAGETAGVAGRFVWTVDVAPYGVEGPPDSAGALMRVAVRVRSRAGGPNLARLASLRLTDES